MASYIQADRTITVSTPLGPDILLLLGFAGHEAISQLFRFQLDLMADNKDVDAGKVAFDKLLGQPVSFDLYLPDQRRPFHGICSRFAQGGRDETFTYYRMEVVPQVWLLTKKAQSRIFQQQSVPQILQEVLKGFDVSFEEVKGTFHPRDFCVQYRETDFNFASRLMEEEGIYYFFRHGEHGHQMVLANTPAAHPELPGRSRIPYVTAQVGEFDEDAITDWEKVQELRSGKYTLWDHCFELPGKHLEADKTIQDSVQAGTVTHKLKIGNNDKLEIFDFPGEYAQRFDGVDRAGGDRSSDLNKIFEDNQRTVGLRMQEETTPGLVIQGAGACRFLASGHRFTLENHYDANGSYVITSVQHIARLSDSYRSAEGGESAYHNSFTCIPASMPFRPPRVTHKPIVQGTQTATVVGPVGEEIHTDKYGRVKVQFHWDREGKHDANSSCWVRVGSIWAGKNWGAIHIPRIDQEVIVAFEEGDPDCPIIVGSVYNTDQMPPYTLPQNKTQSGIKSRSTLGGTPENFNEIRFEDKKGQEQLFIHAERNQDIEVENDETHWVGRDRSKTIDRDETVHVKRDRTETVGRNETITIGNNRTEKVGNNETITIGNNREVTLDMGNDSLTLKMGNQITKLNLGKSETEALQSIELKVGQSSIKLDQMGVTIKGMMITIDGQIQTQVKGLMTQVNGTAMLQAKGGVTMIN